MFCLNRPAQRAGNGSDNGGTVAQELNQAHIGQIGTGLLGHLILKLVDKGVLTLADVTDLKAGVVKDAPEGLQPAVQTFIDKFLEVRN